MYLAVVCYFGANVLSIAKINRPPVRGGQFMLFLITIILCAGYCLLVSRISERGKVALILLSILGVVSAINLVGNMGHVLEQFESDPFVIALEFCANCLQVVALVLLFVPVSRNWFWRARVG
jgi:hypothetical protein